MSYVLRINKRTGERYRMMNSDDMYCDSNFHCHLKKPHQTLKRENTRVVMVGKGKSRVWCVDCFNQVNEWKIEDDLMKRSKLMCPIQYTKCICCLETKKSGRGYGGEQFKGCRICKSMVCVECLYKWANYNHDKYTVIPPTCFEDSYTVGARVPCFVCRTPDGIHWEY